MTHPPATALRPRLSADRLSRAASVCAITGAGLFCLILLYDTLYDVLSWRHAHIAVQICDGGFLASLCLAFLAAPSAGILACVQLLRQRRIFAHMDDLAVLRTVRRRLGHAALLFGIESLLVWLFWPGGGADIDDPFLARVADLWVVVPGLLAAALGIASFRLATRNREGGLARVGSLFAVPMGLGTTVLPWSVMAISFVVSYGTYSTRSPTFNGDSGSLGQTAIVPTLDSPMPAGKNVVWCSSFQLTWNELRDNILHEPVLVKDRQELADRLNAAGPCRDDLDPSSYLVAAGLVGNGVLEEIKAQMNRRFPDVSLPAYEGVDPNSCVMFAYLEAQAKFEHPFENDSDGMWFTDSTGRRTAVASFGVWDDADRYEKVRDQVRVLWSLFPEPDPNQDPQDANDWLETYLRREEFAIDLCRHTEPYQIILAKINPKPTLALTLADLDSKIKAFSQSKDFEYLQKLTEDDELYVPEMFWEISHRFSELEGQDLANPRYPESRIDLAEQMIHFRLDRCGAILKSRATLIATLGISERRLFIFNRPFLICMRKRGCEHPFFVMWVDNAELLVRK